MTGQTLLDIMELLNAELQLQAGEPNVTKGLLALNVAQDYFEGMVALRPKTLGSNTGTVTTTASTESTTFPTGLLRIDRLQLLNAQSRPIGDITPLKRAGGHAATSSWPLNLTSSTGTGSPVAYWTNGTSIYWSPLPSATYTIRWYGLQAAASITAAGAFLYPDVCALPIASFAGRLFKAGIDDDAKDLSGLAVEVFKPVLDLLASFNRDGGQPFEYTSSHDS